jgi:tetratricopeptide (TPR) repeat protein
VHDRSAGNPFFVVELVRLLGTRRRLAAAERAAAHEVPEGVRDVLRRRISGLPEQTQAILLVAAVVGRDFDLDVLRDVSGLDDDRALGAVEAALLSGMVVEEPAVGRFRFAHALVREAIYEDVSRVRRARLHARVAQSLGDAAGAHWWLAAPVVGTDTAVPHLLAAADRALAALAHEEAGEHLRHALDLLAAEPPSAARSRSELDVQLRLGTLYAQLDGARSAAGWAAVTRARELAEELADGPATIAAYRTLYEVAVARAEHAEARKLAERMVAVGGAAADQALAHLAVGRTLWCLGEPAAAKDHLVRSLELAASAPESPHEALPAEVTARLQLAPVLDLLGDRAAADAHLSAAITRARAAPPLVRAGVFTSTALIYALRRDVAVAGEHARRALELAGPLPAWFSYAAAVEGWVRAMEGDPAGGARAVRVSLEEIRSRGARHLVGWVLGLLAEAEVLAGDADQGRRLLEEARALVERTGERMYEADLVRLQHILHT